MFVTKIESLASVILSGLLNHYKNDYIIINGIYYPEILTYYHLKSLIEDELEKFTHLSNKLNIS